MASQIVVPDLGESVIEATVAEWTKQEGDRVAAGETVLVLETDKVTLEVAAEKDGVLARIERQPGDDVQVGDVLGVIEEAAGAPQTESADGKQTTTEQQPQPAPATQESARDRVTPVARRMAEEHRIDLEKVPTRDGERITKEDVQRYLAGREAEKKPAPAPARSPAPAASNGQGRSGREERRRLSRRRQTIARRLVEAQQTAAMLTTFNEVDMKAVMDLRTRRKEAFKEKHGVSLGLSSFFVKAAIGALKDFPVVNAELDGNELIVKHYYDIGIAIGAEEGLVVPVLRQADRMTFAEIESAIRQYAKEIDEGTLSVEALRGGTFTITNGGIFGSMLSTPILNPPQVGILGLHAIKERPVVIDGEIAIRPIMYVALTYDHRIIDGREAVQFLLRIKQLIEDPETLLIEG
jgi:2-oxoglutarate dehydrogenase E2 component (dihydrolipoamide succinyltransferase)